MDITKLKVSELRNELSSRGLDQKGVKAVLVERLKQALEKESQDVQNASDDNSAEGNEEEVKQDNESPNEEEDSVEIPETQHEDGIEPEDQSEQEPISEVMDVEVKQEVEEPGDPADNSIEQKPVIKQEVLDSDLVDKGHDNDYSKKDHYEAEVKQEPQVKEEKNIEENSNNYSNERKRKHSRSPSPENQERPKFTKVWKDLEPEIDDNLIQLSWYDSDLNLVIDQSKFLTASPMSELGFGYVWAGVRANYGFSFGKVCFEIKLLENNDVSHLEDEPSPHVLRVGWSILSSGMLLGEEPFSYGYGGTGKASTNCNFINYGKPFVVGDVVTAYLDYGPQQVVMSFSVNGEWQDVAYTLPYTTFDGQALYPHVLSKNIKFEINFGQNDPWFKTLSGYVWAAHVPNNQRVPGPRRPEKREDCEMLMMCGLPGCGKTVWANEWASHYPEKFYNILGSNNLIDKMKIQGLPRKRNYHGRWDILIEKCMKCLNKLLEMAHKRRRNYILDQTNVFPSAQKRKMRSFGGFVRRAIVIVPTDEEFKRRVAKREAEEGKDVPDSAVMEMKAHFKLPEKGEYFDEVIYTELPEEEARPIVEQYNKEARDAGYGQQKGFSNPGGRGNKRFRPNERQPRGGNGGSHFRGSNRGNNRDFKSGMDHQEDRNRGGWQPRGDRSGWNDRKPGGGFRPGGRDDHNRDHGSAGGNRDDYGRDNFRGRDNYGGRDNFGGSRDNYGGGRGSFGSGRGNFGGGRGSYGGSRGNSGGGRDNSRGDRDNFGGGRRDNFRGGRDNFGGSRDNFGGGRDNFGGGRDNFGGSRDNYERGRDDRSRGGFDRNRRDGPPNRNYRDNKGQGGTNSGPGKQGGSNWSNQGYQQGWDQNQRSSWGQNYQQGWKGSQESQQQNYNSQFQQYGGQQYGIQNPGWNQAPGGVYGYGQQGMNPMGYGYGGAPPNQGK